MIVNKYMQENLNKISSGIWEYRSIFGDVTSGRGEILADIYNDADGLVMAAAPRLLRALIDMVDRIEYYASLKEGSISPNIEDWAYTYNSTDMENAREAIKAALGNTVEYKEDSQAKTLLELLKISEQDVLEGRVCTGEELLNNLREKFTSGGIND